jgi:quinol-cytochrome oxidoreductase complex cytochrome b subunit
MMFAFMPFLDRSRIPGGARYRPIYRLQYYLFLLDMLVLGYVGYMPPTSSTIVMVGQVATFCYFASFFVVPFVSKVEERWLIRRGLPAQVIALMESETRDLEKRKRDHTRNKGDKA